MKEQKHILVATLNWGLGHSARCIPIINCLLQAGVKVTLASDGDALHLLQAEYPQLNCIELPSYNITYKTANMFINIAPQIPKLLRAISLERRFLDAIISEHKIDAIISDNRYGLYHESVPSVFMTHQLNIQIPNRLVQAWVTKTNKRYIHNFGAVWVPDFEKEPSLAGKLSRGEDWEGVHYLGPLSRMVFSELPKVYDVIAVLSGPEPQRSLFEQKIIAQAKKITLKFLIISGKTAEKKVEQLAENIECHSFMTTVELNQAILQSKVVIARSGYSSLMDLVQLRCPKVLLVPTPGQTEQEYLAERFCAKQQFFYQSQKDLNIVTALEALTKFSGASQYANNNNFILEKTIRDFLEKLNEE